jgi:hypothetical protein
MDAMAPIPDSALQRLGGALTELLDDDHWNNIEKNYLLPALDERKALRARVAKLEQDLGKANVRRHVYAGTLIVIADGESRENPGTPITLPECVILAGEAVYTDKFFN